MTTFKQYLGAAGGLDGMCADTFFILRAFTIFIVITLAPLLQASGSFKFEHYSQGVLYMTLVTPTLQGELLLRHEDKIEPLHGGSMEHLFALRVPVPCSWLTADSVIYWALPKQPLVSATIPAQPCQGTSLQRPAKPPVTVFENQAACWVDTGGNTLWHTASELTKINKMSVYQNVYALFITNKAKFAGEDIHRLRSRRLQCPEPTLFRHIAPEHASRLFKESLVSTGMQ